MKYLLLFFALINFAYAQTENKTLTETEAAIEAEATKESSPVEEVKETVEEVKTKALKTADHREASIGTILIGWKPLATWVPSKKTISYTHIFSKEWSLEFEYATASISFSPLWLVDIGGISERRYSLQARKYFGNSFNLLFGAFRNEFEARVGNDILERMSRTSIDEFEVRGTGVTGGLGNRWQWGNGFTLGIDWFRVNVPLLDKKVDNDILNNIDNNNDLSDVRDVIDKLKNLPTFVLFGINLGYTF